MAAKPAASAEGAEAKPKSKKMLIIIVAAVLLLVVGGAAAFLLLKPAAEEEGDGEPVAEKSTKKKKKKSSDAAHPPEFMPLDPVVVNLADPEGTRYAQVGLTLQLADPHTSEAVKKFMPAIRNGILMMIARRSANELLSAEGKETLANDIAEMVREQTDMPLEHGESPVQAVLFSSLIVQ